MKLKVNVAHAVWPGLLVSTITVSRMFVLSLGRFLVVGVYFLRKILILKKLFTLRLMGVKLTED